MNAMRDVWEVKYKGHTIRVENTWAGEQLFVDGVLQDEQVGLRLSSRLYGNLKNEKGEMENIKVSIGSTFLKMQCRIFVADQLIYSTEME